jgi:hypothetical protein
MVLSNTNLTLVWMSGRQTFLFLIWRVRCNLCPSRRESHENKVCWWLFRLSVSWSKRHLILLTYTWPSVFLWEPRNVLYLFLVLRNVFCETCDMWVWRKKPRCPSFLCKICFPVAYEIRADFFLFPSGLMRIVFVKERWGRMLPAVELNCRKRERGETFSMLTRNEHFECWSDFSLFPFFLHSYLLGTFMFASVPPFVAEFELKLVSLETSSCGNMELRSRVWFGKCISLASFRVLFHWICW